MRDDADDTKDRVQWKWSKGAATTKVELGDPLTDERYDLCIYAGGTLRSSTRVLAGGICGDGPCWKESAKGYKYKSKVPGPEGVSALAVTSGEPGKARLLLKGAGTNLEMPGNLSGVVTVQLKASSGFCWQASYSEPFKKNDGVSFVAVGQ